MDRGRLRGLLGFRRVRDRLSDRGTCTPLEHASLEVDNASLRSSETGPLAGIPSDPASRTRPAASHEDAAIVVAYIGALGAAAR